MIYFSFSLLQRDNVALKITLVERSISAETTTEDKVDRNATSDIFGGDTP